MRPDPKPLDLVVGALEAGIGLAKAEMARCQRDGDTDAFGEAQAKTTAMRVAMALCGRDATLPDTASLAAALTSAIAIADEAVTEWDRAPSGARPGKILMALAGHLPGYRKDIDLVHAALYYATARNVAAGITTKVEQIIGHLGRRSDAGRAQRRSDHHRSRSEGARTRDRSAEAAVSEVHQIPSVRLDQSLSVLADTVACYIGSTRSEDGTEPKKLHQMCIAVFLHALLMRSQHKEEMAQILEAVALELREAGGQE